MVEAYVSGNIPTKYGQTYGTNLGTNPSTVLDPENLPLTRGYLRMMILIDYLISFRGATPNLHCFVRDERELPHIMGVGNNTQFI